MTPCLDQALVDSAIALAIARYPVGEALAAALRTRSGRVLTSVCAEALLDSASLCAETGAICESHKLDDPIVASVCVHREDSHSPFRVLPACGICQERLAYWGLDVQIAIPNPDRAAPSLWQARTLRELRPHYWNEAAAEARHQD